MESWQSLSSSSGGKTRPSNKARGPSEILLSLAGLEEDQARGAHETLVCSFVHLFVHVHVIEASQQCQFSLKLEGRERSREEDASETVSISGTLLLFGTVR